MKKKLLTVAMFMGMLFVLASCDFLSTIIAVKGFYTEYQDYSAVYNEATQFTVLTENELIVSDTDVVGFEDINSRVYVMFDQNSSFMYVEQSINEESRSSLYEDTGELYIEYIVEDMVVTPTLPSAEDRYDDNINGNILNENFNYEDVSGENKTGDHTYELDVYLNQAINLDVLSEFVNQLEVFGGDLSSFDNAIAHVVITFTAEESVIELNVTLTDYTITFADETFVTLSLTNHTVLMIPDDFAFPDVFNAPFEMVAVDNIALARRVYESGDNVLYPALSGDNGWVQVSLSEGIYAFEATDPQFTLMVYDADGNEAGVSSEHGYIRELVVTGETQTFYLYISALADTQIDIGILQIDESGVVITTTIPITTQPVTTEAITTNTED